MELRDLGEFGLIEKIKGLFSDICTGGCEGIGDDCAVIPCGDYKALVVTTDMLVEDIHFLRDKISPFELGRKSLAVNLSDIAAMGASPMASFLSIALPRDIQYEWVEQFMNGYKELSMRFGVVLLGGDTTASASGITINITAIGSAKPENIKRRSAARAGDKIFVTGILGDSAQGLADIIGGVEDSPFTTLHNNPRPYIDEGVWLGGQNAVHAMIDISDGLASDLMHILQASGKSAEVKIEQIPFNTDINTAVTGGEDYVLLLTVDAKNSDRLEKKYREKFNTGLYEIGTVGMVADGEPRIAWLDHGVEIHPDWKGFTHF